MASCSNDVSPPPQAGSSSVGRTLHLRRQGNGAVGGATA